MSASALNSCEAKTGRLRLVVLCGPTAVGKTSVAVKLARLWGSEVISVDSRQLYRGMDIGTGKDRQEYQKGGAEVPVHLLDICEPSRIYTLADYQKDFLNLLSGFQVRPEYASGSKPLVVCGGTGLYLQAVLKNYHIARVPEDPGFRNAMMARPIDELDKELHCRDSALWEQTDRSSKKRIVRALEVAKAGVSIQSSKASGPDFDFRVYMLTRSRREIHARIETRLDARLREGLVEEVRQLRQQGITDERMDLLGMEYREVNAFLKGTTSPKEMRDMLLLEIRRLAKRQLTWFRGFPRRGIPVREIDLGVSDAVKEILEDSW